MTTDESRRTFLRLGLAACAGQVLVQAVNKTQAAVAGAVPTAENAVKNERSIKAVREQGPSDASPAQKKPTVDLVGAKSPAPTFARSSPDQKTWSETVKALTTSLLLTSTGTISGELSPRLYAIDHYFQFVAEKGDEAFSVFHVEPLLDQAADLLDRGLRDRATWDELGARWISLLLELHEYANLDEIHQREEAAGMYDLSAKQSYSDLMAEIAAASGANQNTDILTRLLNGNLSAKECWRINLEAQKAAWLSGVVPYSWGDQVFNGYKEPTVYGVKKKVADHASDAAEAQTEHSLNRERTYASVQKLSWEVNSQVATVRQDGQKAKYDWDALNANFLRERTLVARRLQDIKTRIATDPEGLLNHGKRLDALRERFNRDFRDALARLMVVREGLKSIYGFDAPLPAATQNSKYFDDCLIWARSAIQWLIRFARQEQSFVYPISVREIVGEEAWNRGCKSGKWNIAVTREMFINMTNLRIRGLSAFAEVCASCDKDRLWRVMVSPPRDSIVYHHSGTSVKLDQSRITPAHLHRVTSRNAARDPDVVSISAWHNVSPLGVWTVEMTGAKSYTNAYSQLKDINLDVIISYRTATAGIRGAK